MLRVKTPPVRHQENPRAQSEPVEPVYLPTLLKWWGQAEQNAGDGKRPLLVLHPAGAAYADSLAVVRLADLAEPHPVRRKGAETETDGVWATPGR